jgi:hypothetical protein
MFGGSKFPFSLQFPALKGNGLGNRLSAANTETSDSASKNCDLSIKYRDSTSQNGDVTNQT